jgi:hypothetical protein
MPRKSGTSGLGRGRRKRTRTTGTSSATYFTACRFDRRELETALNRYRASLVLWPGVWMLVERQPVFTPKPNRLIVSVLVQTWEFDPNNTWLIAVPKPIWLLGTTL